MDCKAQVSIEYLLLALFGITIAMVAGMLIDGISAIAQTAQGKILEYRYSTIAALLRS
jgi:uncharacterized protein (UPF0333 family)